MSYKFKFEFECLDRGRVKGNRIELAKNILILGQIYSTHLSSISIQTDY